MPVFTVERLSRGHQRGSCRFWALIFNLVLMAFPAIFAGF